MSDRYKAIVDFTDLEDRDHIYKAGDPYPREGKEVDEKRVAELSSTSNKRQERLIMAVNEDAPSVDVEAEDYEPKHTGGGWYELSNGERVQGKEAAIEAEKALQK